MIEDYEEEAGAEASEVQTETNDQADPISLVEKTLPIDLLEKYKFASYGRALSVLAHGFPDEFNEILDALREFNITTGMIRRPGGNESEIPKEIARILRPRGWHETTIVGDLQIRREWKVPKKVSKSGKQEFEKRSDHFVRRNFFDGHKIDFVKGRVAFDFEWNSKDQTFDRDLSAFDAFATAGAIDVAVIVTRDTSLNPIFQELGTALKKDGVVATNEKGDPIPLAPKYGASTTWWGKLIYRLNAGRNGGCPVLVVGITPMCISDLEEWRSNYSAASTPEL
jgi:Restriction endonuclease BglII